MNVPESLRNDAHGVKAGQRAAREESHRSETVSRLKAEGAARTFDPMPGVAEDAAFLDERCRYVVLSLAHQGVSPVAPGPRFRVNGAFPTAEAARERALAVHSSDEGTVTIGQLHAWQVCARDMALLQDPVAGGAHATTLLAAHEARVTEGEEAAAVRKHVQLHEQVTVEDVLPARDEAARARVDDWLLRHTFTVERWGSPRTTKPPSWGYARTPARATPSGGGRIRAPRAAVAACDPVLEQPADTAAPDPVPEQPADTAAPEPVPEQPPEPAAPGRRAPDAALRPTAAAPPATGLSSRCSATTRARCGGAAVLCGVRRLRYRGDGRGHVRNVASTRVHDHNLHIVSMYEWLNLHDAGSTRVVYRDTEMQRIVDAQRTQRNRITAMENDMPRDKQGGGVPLLPSASA